ncbi:small glutamine-rich tetratricopeptide repeat-containing protein alpha-like [Leptonychotes weddellii]|uniref:Small glutamine-rich tetratricopeptide repeat-containing protein alpha-like n=1 Tax=Leptonychotes weddellii TaxID=9713 RepID=A0A2U3YNH5_LEPWE|nr:small glutamine-rich tetratricopeptide repeat-containing protein alpha-like [Leptonychotes weddellii]
MAGKAVDQAWCAARRWVRALTRLMTDSLLQASNLMNNPQVQQLMSGMISGGHNPLGTPGTSPSQNDLASLIQAGQQFAQQMQQQNPELIEQLRSQIRSRTPSASNDDQQE